MIAVLGGLGAATAWMLTTLCARRSTRLVGPYAGVAWVMLIGFAIMAPLALASGVPEELDAANGAWAVLGGLGAVCGLVSVYAGLRVGQVGIVAPIAATEGAIAAVIAIAFGEEVGLAAGVLLAVTVAGIVLASAAPAHDGGRGVAAGAWWGGAAAVCFGVSLYSIGRAGEQLGATWTLFGVRLVALLVLVLPLVLLRRMPLVRAAVPYVAIAGVLELVGGVAFIWGADDSVAVAAVVASQYAAMLVAIGYLALDERLGRWQAVGVGVVLVGVAALAAVQA